MLGRRIDIPQQKFEDIELKERPRPTVAKCLCGNLYGQIGDRRADGPAARLQHPIDRLAAHQLLSDLFEQFQGECPGCTNRPSMEKSQL